MRPDRGEIKLDGEYAIYDVRAKRFLGNGDRFRTVIEPGEPRLFAFVAGFFRNPLNVGLYSAAMIVVALHVRHGLWSAFQTLGANHPKYMPGIEKLSLAFGLLVAVGLGALPLFFLFSVNSVAG